MHISINPADLRPIYAQIMDEVRRAIVMGTLRPEDPLPSVRQVAADLRVNFKSVAQAYQELEREGLVYVRRGQGTFVASVQADERERRALVNRVAERALLDAHRNGIAADEFINAIREIAELHLTRSRVDQP